MLANSDLYRNAQCSFGPRLATSAGLPSTPAAMKFHLSTGEGNTVTAYGEDFVRINAMEYRETIIVRPDRVITGWAPGGYEALSEADFEALAELKPELVVLGTGRELRFPHPRLSRSLAAARIGLEVMATGAACRTYNILAAEGRQVAAALMIER